jgi:two-component system, OmpR family, phosphate regulon sensor histidine kinase PhoR
MAMRESELNQVKSLFVSNVSHELKTPLTKINLFNDLLQRLSEPEPEKRQRYHRVIQQECERLGMLVDNVLDLGRIERGKMDYNFEELEVNDILYEVAETFNVIYEARGYSIDLDIEEGLPAVMVDPGAMKQALINLTDNAVKYSERAHRLEVRARRGRLQGRPAVSISITDQGIGIPKEHIALIFEEFYRAESGQQHRASGSGLGLALVRHIVDAHDGTIGVESKVGEGSTFTISLPVLRKKETESR